METEERRIIYIGTLSNFANQTIAVCNDGTVWVAVCKCFNTKPHKWERLDWPSIPQDKEESE